MIKYLLLFVLLINTPAWSSHIVGGEFELLHLKGNTYQLNVNFYFDVHNGHVDAEDAEIGVKFYQKSNNNPIMYVVLPLKTRKLIKYTKEECAVEELNTRKLIYSTTILLNPTIFNHPKGYYIVWERCCRNYSITNVVSNNPTTGGLHAGQTFYLEFPPVVKNGKPFINSSPKLPLPLSNYGCPNKPYWANFRGTDVDGDLLVYSLVTPLNTHTPKGIPFFGPGKAPFPLITWKKPFSINNIMNGSPHLSISKDGFLTVTPTKKGLYVFSVKCEEFRNGEKIGEVTRDFQILVLANCQKGDPPKIKVKKLGEKTFSDLDELVVNFDNTITDENRCLEVQISDPDALKVESGMEENIYLKAIPLNFKTKQDVNKILPIISNAVLKNGSVAEFKICFDKCPYTKKDEFELGIVAFDDACALPLSDTLKIKATIVTPNNTPAKFITPDKTISIAEGTNFTYPIEGIDVDNDMLAFDIITDGFKLADVGMSFINEIITKGQAKTTFLWRTKCIYGFTKKTKFEIKILLNDLDKCNFGIPDTLTLNLQVLLPKNTKPIITSNLKQLNIEHNINEPLNFNVLGMDNDGDDIKLTLVGDGFNPSEYGMNFPTITGNSNIQGHFSWTPLCDFIKKYNGGKFKLNFILNDFNKCKFYNPNSANALVVTIRLIDPLNKAPSIKFNNLNTKINFSNNFVSLTLGDLLNLEIIAEDENKKNSIELKLLSVNENSNFLNFSFKNTKGIGKTSSILKWKPNCSNLETGFAPKNYTLIFSTNSKGCATIKKFTTKLVISVKDVNQLISKFTPANIITPNSDGKNDYYYLPNLPLNSCLGQFVQFKVHNRWGIEIYKTTDRNFKWDAKNLKTGVYYYIIKFTNEDYKGTINILY